MILLGLLSSLTTSLATPAPLQDRAGPVPVLEWEPYELRDEEGETIPDVFVAKLTVPMNRAKPDGPTIRLAVLKLAGSPEGPPLVHLHGGPGGLATGLAGLLLWQDLRDTGDVILLDQRGCGRSEPALYLQPLPEGVPADVFASREALGRYLEAVSRETATALREQGIEPSAFHNLENVADLEDLRRALGVERLNILGFSYGSHLGLLWLRAHPGSIANAVLIGVEGLDMTSKLPRTYDVHWRRLALLAARDPALASHAAEIAELLPRALAELRREPLAVKLPDPVTGAARDYLVGPYGLELLLVLDLGDSSDIPVIPRLLHEVVHRRTSLLAWFVRKRLGLVAGFPVTMFTMDAGAWTPQGRSAAIAEQRVRAVLSDSMNFSFPEAEACFEPRRFGAEYCEPLISSVRTLFVSGELDSNTPPFQAEEVRFGFSDSTHLVARNAGHEGSWMNNDRSIAAIRDFLSGEDVSGRSIDLPTLRFAPLEGPASVAHPALE